MFLDSLMISINQIQTVSSNSDLKVKAYTCNNKVELRTRGNNEVKVIVNRG